MMPTAFIITLFVVGYLGIAFEHKLKIDKAAIALGMGVVCWSIYLLNVEQLLPLEMIPTWFQNEV